MRLHVRILGIGADVLLNHRRQRRLTQVPIAIDPRIDQKIDVVRVSPGLAGDSPWPSSRQAEVRCDGCATHPR